MAKYITTVQFTEKGVSAIRETAKRASMVTEAAKALGVNISHIFWTMGDMDGVLVFEAPDDETAAAVMMHISSMGNVRTKTMRAFETAEIEKIVNKLP